MQWMISGFSRSGDYLRGKLAARTASPIERPSSLRSAAEAYATTGLLALYSYLGRLKVRAEAKRE
jgi:hypothetical protein